MINVIFDKEVKVEDAGFDKHGVIADKHWLWLPIANAYGRTFHIVVAEIVKVSCCNTWRSRREWASCRYCPTCGKRLWTDKEEA